MLFCGRRLGAVMCIDSDKARRRVRIRCAVAIDTSPRAERARKLRMQGRIIFTSGNDSGSTVFEAVIKLSCSSGHCRQLVFDVLVEQIPRKHTLIGNRNDLLEILF